MKYYITLIVDDCCPSVLVYDSSESVEAFKVFTKLSKAGDIKVWLSNVKPDNPLDYEEDYGR